MALGGILRAIDRLAGRFNRWFAPAAISSSTLPNDPGRSVDPSSVVAILGELEQSGEKRAHRTGDADPK